MNGNPEAIIPMKIGLDYDETITRDYRFWGAFIALANRYGHTVTIVTSRYPSSFNLDNSDIESFARTHGVKVVYCNQKPKAECFQADVWVDDCPGAIPVRAE